MPATLELAAVAALFALRRRHSDGRLHGAAARHGAVVLFMAVSLVGVSLPTFLIAHPAALRLLGAARLAAVLRARRRRGARILDDRAADRSRAQGDHPAVGDARAVPDDADHAAGARRDAGGAAHRLHQVRPRPRAVATGPSISAMR